MVTKQKKKRRTRGKGFRRSARQWEEAASRHIGKFIDRVKLSEALDVGLALGCGYVGYKTFFDDPAWFLAGAIGYKLAMTSGVGESSFSVNSPLFGVEIPINSQVVGLGILGVIGIKGIGNILTHIGEETRKKNDDTIKDTKEGTITVEECATQLMKNNSDMPYSLALSICRVQRKGG